jgi:uncharacterized protein (TIGR03083 family)
MAVTPSISNLAAAWASLESLLQTLTEDEWKAQTGCPGWSVQDNVSHLIDYEEKALTSQALSRPTDGDRPPHVKNDLGASNEPGVAVRRSKSGPEVLAELRSVTAARLTQLHELSADDLTHELDLPVGRGTVADMLTLRVMDTWSHEQDIRRAVGKPGHVEGPAVDESIGYFCRFLPIVIVKRAGAPADAVVVFEVGDRPPFAVVVKQGRGSIEPVADTPPTVVLAMPVTVFGGLVCGRSDVTIADVDISGDADLGARVVGAMAFMP